PTKADDFPIVAAAIAHVSSFDSTETFFVQTFLPDCAGTPTEVPATYSVPSELVNRKFLKQGKETPSRQSHRTASMANQTTYAQE
ncbi:MAG TPA: hypothetical protein VMD30_00395, partial [Tepidisphaeraceae bacterium]|nr:hypothetical protein [Tepidisphaeraceae bacterium]